MRTRVLHIIPSASSGGIEALVVALLENIDKNRFQIDFAVFNPNNPTHRAYMEQLGAKVYFIAEAGTKSSLVYKLLWRINAVINYFALIYKNNYDVLHCHHYTGFGAYVLLATLRCIPVRIVHSHNAGSMNESRLSKAFRRIKNILSFECLITHKIGCSDSATAWLYGKSNLESGKAFTIYNGIDMKKFSSIDDRREFIRKKYELEEGIHFIHVGRFTVLKNQVFLIDLFHEIVKFRKDVCLNIVGFGPLENIIYERVKNNGIEDKVKFYDYELNVSELIKAMDFFLLPSISEAFPITALEAQASNVPIFISDKVTKEVDMGLAIYLPIDRGPKYWADNILQMIESKKYPKELNLEMTKAFDIKNVVKQYEALYGGKRAT